MSDLTITSKGTLYATSSTGRYSGISSSTINSKASSSTVKTSSTTVTKTSGTITSSTTMSYGASSTQSAIKITASSTTVKTTSTTPSTTVKTTSTTPSTTVKTTSTTPSTTVKTTSTTVKTTSTTPSTTVKTTSTTPSTTAKTTSTTPSTTQLPDDSKENKWKDIFSVLGKEIGKIYSSIKEYGEINESIEVSQETEDRLNYVSTPEELTKYIKDINNKIYDGIIDKINYFLDNSIKISNTINLFDINMNSGDNSLRYYADLTIEDKEGFYNINISKELPNIMDDFFDFDDFSRVIESGNFSLEIDSKDNIWITASNDNTLVKMNLVELMSGNLDCVYEKNNTIQENDKGSTKLNMGLEIKINMKPGILDDITEEYKEAFEKELRTQIASQKSPLEEVGEFRVEFNKRLGTAIKNTFTAIGAIAVAIFSLPTLTGANNSTNGFMGSLITPIRADGKSRNETNYEIQ